MTSRRWRKMTREEQIAALQRAGLCNEYGKPINVTRMYRPPSTFWQKLLDVVFWIATLALVFAAGLVGVFS